MSVVLLITDDPDRTRSLARDLGRVGTCLVSALFGTASPPVARPDLIISDVESASGETLVLLRHTLAVARRHGAPYLCLLHEDTPRARAQANALGADGMLGAAVASDILVNAVACLREQEGVVAASTSHRAREAGAIFEAVFRAGQPVTHTLVDIGTAHVERAVRDTGICDWLRVVRCFDDATHQHCLLVAGLAAAFGNALGLASGDRHCLTKAALLHDVGKARIPLAILNKPGPLTEDEMAVMRTHPAHGRAMLAGGRFEPEMLAVVRSHHEAIDGSGYPDGLGGDAIPDLVRLVSVCDVYAALIERRSYKAPMSLERAYETLQGMVGKLDADLVSAFRPVAYAFSASAHVS